LRLKNDHRTHSNHLSLRRTNNAHGTVSGYRRHTHYQVITVVLVSGLLFNCLEDKVMNIQTKASLEAHIQSWLDKEKIQDALGGIECIYCDATNANRMSMLMASACEIVIDSMRVQANLHEENNA